MAINTFQWHLTLQGVSDLARYLKDGYGKKNLERDAKQVLRQAIQPTSFANPPNLQVDYLDVYGEQVTDNALADIGKYFAHHHIPGTTPGGLSTGVQPLSISARDVKCSVTAKSVIGEGLAGWFFEQAGWVPLARPIGHPTDIVFLRGNDCAVVQVKSTELPDVKSVIAFAAAEHAGYVRHLQDIDPMMNYFCHIVGGVIKDGSDFDILSLSVLW